MTDISIQQRLFPDATCFGCGQANPQGLRLESFRRENYVHATFEGQLHHTNGLGFLNGGIIATVLDCHSGAAALDEADRAGRTPAEGLPYSYVTSGLNIRFLRPAPLLEPCDLQAFVLTSDEDLISVEVELIWKDKRCAHASSEWRRWRPRPSPAVGS